MKQSRKGMLMAALICGTVVPVVTCSSNVYAAEVEDEALKGFTLDQIVVTATREERRDVDTPASTEVFTREDIKATGANNVAGVISKIPGIAYKSFGVAGASMGTMINEVTIRGVDSGTLVMINGNSINWRGKYNLEAIQADEVERIEIVKGGGSVLYGSEAAGGVINIITKKKADNYVKAGIGNFGHKEYGANVGNDIIQVSYENEKWDGTVDKIAESQVTSTNSRTGVTTLYGETKTSVKDVRRENIGVNYNINKNLNLNYHYFKSKANYVREVTDSSAAAMRVGDTFNYRIYTTEQHIAQLQYNDKLWKASLYFTSGTTDSFGNTYFSSTGTRYPVTNKSYFYNTREKNSRLGVDVQRTWRIGNKVTAILGADFKHERWQKLPTHTTDGSSVSNSPVDAKRNIWGIYGQWDQKIDDKNSFILSARETVLGNATNGMSYSNFSGAGQFIHKLDENQSLYASVAQSFILPEFSQMYGASSAAIGNPDLKPQKGLNYEIGWKKIAGAHNWKLALYSIRIKDKITAKYNTSGVAAGTYTYENEDFKNEGIEFGDTIKTKGPWSFNWAISYNNPKSKGTAKPYWDRAFGRYQLTGGIGYNSKKFSANLSGSFLGDRVQTPSTSPSYETRPYFLTTLMASYRPAKDHEFTLTIDNLLNRHDILSHSSSSYYSTPINFLFEYKYKF